MSLLFIDGIIIPMDTNREKLVKRHQTLVAKLKSIVNPFICSVESWFGNSITLTINNFAVVIIPHQSERAVATNKLVKIVYDENYNILESILNNKEVSENFEDSSHVLNNLIFALRPLKKNEAIIAVDKVYDYPIKEALIKYYKLKVNPLKEYFLFGNDEIGLRYRDQQKPLKVTSKGVKVIIKDKSALLITGKDGKLHIDLNTTNYLDDKFIYLDKNIYELIPSTKDQCDLVSMSSKNNEKKYLKISLKNGVDLKSVDKLAYQKADKMALTLKKNKKGEFFFENKKGQVIHIGHPDLLITVV